MRNPAAVDEGGRARRLSTHVGATAIALTGHLAVLFALAYEPARESAVDDLPAAITVEIVLAPLGGSMIASHGPAMLGARHPTEIVGPVQASATIEEPERSGSPLAAFAAPMAPACGLRGPLQEALQAFLSVLDRYSLADLIQNPGALRRMRRLLTDVQAIEVRA